MLTSWIIVIFTHTWPCIIFDRNVILWNFKHKIIAMSMSFVFRDFMLILWFETHHSYVISTQYTKMRLTMTHVVLSIWASTFAKTCTCINSSVFTKLLQSEYISYYPKEGTEFKTNKYRLLSHKRLVCQQKFPLYSPPSCTEVGRCQ